MTITVVQWTLDVSDVAREALFWSEALGFAVRKEEDGSAHLVRRTQNQSPITVWLQPTESRKPGKNRLHLDFDARSSHAADAEIERLLQLGAARVDVGQSGHEGFVVLADPEGNEFCVFTRARDLGLD